MLTYNEALAYLASLEPRGWRLGLDRMRAFVDRAGLTEMVSGSRTKYIHVAGTNGKGSVTAFVQSILVEHGFRTGAFFSPYVVDPRERVQFARDLIPENDYANIVEALRPIAESFSETDFGGITEFEFKTAVGLEFWRRMDCEWVAMEVGLGGRFDATNVITPACSVIVSIGLDHTAILGDTLAKIAYEKAGIIKPGVPVIVGSVPDDASAVIRQVASEADSPSFWYGQDFSAEWRADHAVIESEGATVSCKPSIAGEIQAHNASLAYKSTAMVVPDFETASAVRGLETAFVPGRYQLINAHGVRWVLDGAHNPAAARVLRDSLQHDFPGKQVFLTGMVGGHDPSVFYTELADTIKQAHVSPIYFHRALDPQIVAQAMSPIAPSTPHATLEEAIRASIRDAGSEGTIVVTGSFYLVGDVLRWLQRN